jgi:hypothetical protein
MAGLVEARRSFENLNSLNIEFAQLVHGAGVKLR